MSEPTLVVMFCAECGARMYPAALGWQRSCDHTSPAYWSNVKPNAADTLLWLALTGRKRLIFAELPGSTERLYFFGPLQ